MKERPEESTRDYVDFEKERKFAAAGSITDAMVAREIMGSAAGSEVPEYSTDIKAAWLVIERMYELGWWSETGRCGDEGPDAWVAAFRIAEGEEFRSYAPTAALAICRAALWTAPEIEG